MPFLPSLRSHATLLDVFKAYVSGLNHCRYCHVVHTATAERLGIEAGAVRQLMANPEQAPIAEKMKPVLRYAQKLTQAPNGVTQADADAILGAGWPETAIYHTVAVTALFNCMNRLVEGLGIELDAAYADLASQRLAAHGYLPLIAMLTR